MITLDALSPCGHELTTDQLDTAAGGLLPPVLPPIEGWWCLLFPELCNPWF